MPSPLIPVLIAVCSLAASDGSPRAEVPAGLSPPAPADRPWSDGPQLVIKGARVDPASRRLTIEGAHFGSVRLPTVRVGSEYLSIQSATDARVVTDPLPSTITPGQHVLMVIAGNDRTQFDAFSITVGDGAPGTAGEVGSGPNRIEAVDRGGDVGWDTAVGVGADGLPLILYLDYTNRDLKLARCADLECGTSDHRAIDTEGDVGWSSAIAITGDGLPVLSYFDNSRRDLKVALCADPRCDTFDLRTLDAQGQAGQHTSLAIGPDGRPVIAYYDKTRGDLKVAYCRDATCEAPVLSVVDGAGDVGWYTSMAIGQDGRADHRLLRYHAPRPQGRALQGSCVYPRAGERARHRRCRARDRDRGAR